MESLDAWRQLALVLAASAVLPSLWVLARRRSPARRRGLAWWCLWAGQLLVPLGLVAWLSLLLGHDMLRLGSPSAAIAFGAGGAAVAAWVAVQAARLLGIGASLLRGAHDIAVAGRCRRIATGAHLGLLGVLALYGLMLVLPIPGRFGALMFLVAIVGPLGVAATIVLVVALVARRLVRR